MPPPTLHFAFCPRVLRWFDKNAPCTCDPVKLKAAVAAKKEADRG